MSSGRLMRVKFVIAYDGTDFSGWQLQPGRRTVQGEMEVTARRLCGRRVSMTGSGRTDAGVHAAGQVVHADLFHDELGRFERGFSPMLPRDVSVLSVEEVPPDFHARFSAVSRLYRYRIARRDNPLTSRFEHVLDRDLDTSGMKEAASLSVGAASWRAMAKEGGSNSGWDVEVLSADVFEDTLGWTFLIRSNRFLRGMVRLWVGTLVSIGTHRAAPGLILELLNTGNRELAGPSLPARGLTLLKVRFP
jgi:tRNA pseudouridine38-40 synthase